MEKSKVAVVACPDYEPARVKESLQKGLEAIGGLESLIGKEENILLKPNLVRSAKRERAVVTDPEVMDALITILQENGYENISCGDSCGLGTPEGIAKEAGLKEVLEKHNVPLKDFLTSERVETADGKFLMIAKDALDCDALISVSKMKTHALERITGAVKNQYGCISGVYKKLGHTQYPNAESFAHMLIELNQKVAPRLYICDGIVAMEGNGPTSGDPVSMGVLLMSTDPIAGILRKSAAPAPERIFIESIIRKRNEKNRCSVKITRTEHRFFDVIERTYLEIGRVASFSHSFSSPSR